MNGQWRDPVTGWYHLGQRYRVYNPVLRRFHSPDGWCPFDTGEINAYVYCLSDPVNRSDPSGRSSNDSGFGSSSLGRDLFLGAVGILASIAAGILTGGASLAIEVGVAIVVGAASEAAAVIVYDASTGGKGVSAGANILAWRALSKGFKAVGKTASKAAAQKPGNVLRASKPTTLFHSPGTMDDGVPIAFLKSVNGNPRWRGIVTHGIKGKAVGWNSCTGSHELMGPSRFVGTMMADAAHIFEHPEEYDKVFLFICHAGTTGSEALPSACPTS
ncbi:hypothetical protein PG989_000982 [Apiospora arundinis]